MKSENKDIHRTETQKKIIQELELAPLKVEPAGEATRRGRPKTPINKRKLEKLAIGEFTAGEMCQMLGIKSAKTLQRFLKKEYNVNSLNEFKELSRAPLRALIIDKLVSLAEEGNEKILIFLAEHYLGLKKDDAEAPQTVIFNIAATPEVETIEVEIANKEELDRERDPLASEVEALRNRVSNKLNGR